MQKDKPIIVFVFNILQDVTIFWPLALLLRKETEYPIHFVISSNFTSKDTNERWRFELAQLELRVSATVHWCDSAIAMRNALNGRRGVILAASESSLNPHKFCHEGFKAAPPSFVRVTLQHGYECPGFRQNKEQSLAFSDRVGFAADIICSWTPVDFLTHTQLDDLSKVVVTGPTSRLVTPTSVRVLEETPPKLGLVCENLHSTRMSAVGDFKNSYISVFQSFAKFVSKAGGSVALRPHPGGQYVVKNAVDLPDGMVIHNDPMYRTDLSQYAYGISAPSSVLVDMVLAGIPTAVWQDCDGIIDASAYEGLTKVSTLGEWIAFANAAVNNPRPFIEMQNEFLRNSGLIVERDEVKARFLRLIRGLLGNGPGSRPKSQAKRILFVANGDIPTLQICFEKPLAGLFATGTFNPLLITEAQVRKAVGPDLDVAKGQAWFDGIIRSHSPDIAVFCRYSGPLTEEMMNRLRSQGCPTIYHIDDDLLNVPKEIGLAKYKEHNAPDKVLSVSCGLTDADLVYCSTEALAKRISSLGFTNRIVTGKYHCSGDVIVTPSNRPTQTIGYMGFDHSHDLAMITPSLVELLEKHSGVRFELFGTIQMPAELAAFGDRVSSHLPVRPYSSFLARLASLRWDVGLCPLADTSFNRYKANNKWVEYTSTGAAVVATAGMVYDGCCADDCGILISKPGDWFNALDELCSDPLRRHTLVENAQRRLQSEYSSTSLQNQILQIFDEARLTRLPAKS